MHFDPAKYNQEVSGPDADPWKESMRDEAQSLIDHDVCSTGLVRPRGLTQFRLSS